MGVVNIQRFDVFLIALDPTKGLEIQKARPAVVVSPDEMNQHIRTVIILPMTTKGTTYKTRIPIVFQQKEGKIVVDQIRTVDKTRLVKKLGKITDAEAALVLSTLQELFLF